MLNRGLRPGIVRHHGNTGEPRAVAAAEASKRIHKQKQLLDSASLCLVCEHTRPDVATVAKLLFRRNCTECEWWHAQAVPRALLVVLVLVWARSRSCRLQAQHVRGSGFSSVLSAFYLGAHVLQG